MVWFKIDDGFSNSKPVLHIPRRFRTSAIGLWTLAGAWSAKELTDGHIPAHLLEEFCSTPAMARYLVDANLWEVTEKGWRFRNWDKYQPTKSQVETNREQETERKRKYRESHRRPNGTTTGQTTGHHPVSQHPDPTRPDPTHISTDVDISNSPANAVEESEPDRFEEFWKVYNKSAGKKNARTKWGIALKKKGVTPELLITAAAEYIEHQKANGDHPKYTKDATKWLNGEHWNDERTARSTPQNKADQRMQANVSVIEQLQQREQRENITQIRQIGQ